MDQQHLTPGNHAGDGHVPAQATSVAGAAAQALGLSGGPTLLPEPTHSVVGASLEDIARVLASHPDPGLQLESVARLAAIVAGSEDAIVAKDLGGIVRSWNNAAERIFGYTASEMIGRPVGLLLPPERADEEPRILAKLCRGERVENFETVRVRKDGRRIDVSVTISPIRGRGGQIIGASKIARDITERKRTLDTMRQSESTLRRLLESSADCIKILDTDARLVWMNGPGQCLIELDDFERVRGTSWLDFWTGSEREAAAAAVEAAVRGEVGTFEGFLATASGKPKWWSITVTPVLDDAGRPERLMAISRDITERRRAEDALRRSEERFQLINRATSDVIWDWDLTNNCIYWTGALERTLGYKPEQINDGYAFWNEHVHPDDWNRINQSIACVMDCRVEAWSDEYRFRRADGTYATVLDRGHLSFGADGNPVRMVGSMLDITGRRRTEDQLRHRDALLEAVAQASNRLLTRTDFDRAIFEALAELAHAIRADRAYVLEHHREPGTGRLLASQRYEWCDDRTTPQLDNPDMQNMPYEGGLEGWLTELERGRAVGGVFRTLPEAVQARFAGQEIRSILVVPVMLDHKLWGIVGFDDCHTERAWDEAEVTILTTMAGNIGGAFARDRSEARLRYETRHDSLTGLPNRVLLSERIDHRLAACRRDETQRLAVLFLDLDHFKVVNDSLGHTAGDRLLTTVANRIRGVVAAAGLGPTTIARLGGDEFTLFVERVTDYDAPMRLAQRLLEAVTAPVAFEGHDVTPTASVGIVVGGVEYASAADVLRDADSAMYRAKAAGRNRCVRFDTTMYAEAMRRLRLETELRGAAERGELLLHYQPIVSLGERRVRGLEALIRWRRHGALVSPADFIPVAEDTGLIVDIGRWVLSEAVRQAAEWQTRKTWDAETYVAVNLSRRQLQDHGLAPHLQNLLERHRIEPATLVLEVTESMVMEEGDGVREVLAQLRGLGVTLAMDDFGTGYSSLSCLNRLPMSVLKVDRAFVRNLDHRRDGAVLHAVMDLAHNLGMSVVAEGIETAEQLAFLQAVGCDAGQGYLFAKPMPASEVEGFVLTPLARSA